MVVEYFDNSVVSLKIKRGVFFFREMLSARFFFNCYVASRKDLHTVKQKKKSRGLSTQIDRERQSCMRAL